MSQLEFLGSKHFKWAQITSILGASERTLRRGKEELNVDDEEHFINMSDHELFEVITEVRELTPNIGQSRMMGALRSRYLVYN